MRCPALTVNAAVPGAPLMGLARERRLHYLATMVSRTVLLLLVLAGCLAACGSSAPPPATHEHFRAIQRHEATLDRARTPALEGECSDACPATTEGCLAARRICAIAEPTSDVDARLRCRQATERCAQYESATSRCTCGG